MSATTFEPVPDVSPPDHVLALRQQHGIVLALALGVITLSYVFTTIDNERVAFFGLPQLPLPTICQSRLWLNMDCAGCGLTRSFIHFFHGRWHESLQMHRLGWLLASLTVLQIPYRLAALATLNGLPLGKTFPQAIGYGLLILLAVSCLLKLADV